MSDSSSNQVYLVLKRLRKKHTTNHCFSHSEGPEVAANVMADYQRQIFGGDQVDFSTWRASRSPLHQHTTKPSFFSASAIKRQLSAMGNRKAPGDDHASMVSSLQFPLRVLYRVLHICLDTCLFSLWPHCPHLQEGRSQLSCQL